MSQLLVAPLEALTDSLLSDPERRVLLALFSWRSKTTNTVWPSMGEIGVRANISDLTRISKITTSLANKGWLTKKKKGFTGCNEYTLVFPERLKEENSNLDLNANLAPDTNLDSDTKSNLDSDTKSMLVPETKYKEHTNEQTIEQTSIKKINKKDSVEEIFEFWKTTMNHPKAKLDGKRRTLITKHLDLGYPPEDLRAAIVGCSKSPHHMGQNDQGTVYDDLGLILRDAGKIDGFIKKSTQVIPDAKTQQRNAVNGTSRGLAPDDTSWANGVFDTPSFGSGVRERGVQAVEGDFSRVDSCLENAGRGIGNASPVVARIR